MKLAFSQPVFEKYSNIVFHEHPSNGSRAVPCERTEGRSDRLTDTDKTTPIAAYRSFANAAQSVKLLTKQPTFQDAILQEYDTVSPASGSRHFEVP